MDKIKFFLIGLICLLAVSILLNLQTWNAKTTLEKQKRTLTEANAELEARVSKITRELQRAEESARVLSLERERILQEKEELQNRYDSVDKARQELVEKLKSVKAQPIEQPREEVQPASSAQADAYWAGILKAKAALEVQVENIRSELKNLQDTNEKLQKAKGDLDLEINGLKLEKQDLKRQLDYSQKQLTYNQKSLDSLTLELVGEKNDKGQISDTLKALKNENTVLKRQLMSLTGRKGNLERKIQELQEDNSRFEKRFNEMDILLKDKVIEIEKLRKQITLGKMGRIEGREEDKSSVELPPIVVRPQSVSNTPQAAGQSHMGKVIALNKDNNFVIVDLGQEAGVKIGDTFKVYRDDTMIAQIEVIQIRKSISACDVKKETAPVAVGDIIK